MNEHLPHGQSLLEPYRSVERHCERMLDAARAADWDSVGRISGELQALIAMIRFEAADAELPERERSEKFRILSSIVRIDAQIRHLCDPWQARIDALLGGSRSAAGGGARPA